MGVVLIAFTGHGLENGALLDISTTLAFARRWPTMWTDGQRTAEGER